uniref:Uncharacterized protein n=1 Tax=Brassica campestris TaxID=3711 RepID=M4FHT0_BRACM
MSKIDVARLNAPRPNPKPSEHPQEPVRTPSYDGEDPMEEDRVSTGRTLRRRKEKVVKHLKRGANDKEKENFRKRKSTDTAYDKSIDTDVNHSREGNDSIGSWADEYHHESFAVESTTYAPKADKLQASFTDKELLNMQRRDNTDQIKAEAAWERTRFSQSIDTHHQQSIDTLRPKSIDINNTTSIDNHPIQKTTVSEKDKLDKQYLTPDKFGIFRDPDGYVKAIDGRTLHVSRKDIADILQTSNRADNLFMHHRNNPEQKATKEFYDTAGGIVNNFKQRSRHTTHPSIEVDVPTVDKQQGFGRRAYDLYGHRKLYWEERDEYGVYKDDQRYAIDLDGNTIRLKSADIRRVLERASRDEPSYICLPEHANLFTHTELVPEIYTKDEINEMFYGVCGEHERNKEAFQMKLDGVYYLLNDSIIWITTCMEEMKQDIARIQNATDTARRPSIDRRKPQSIDSRRPPSIDRHHRTSIDNRMTTSIDTNPPRPHTMKSQQDFHTREEID